MTCRPVEKAAEFLEADDEARKRLLEARRLASDGASITDADCLR
jgi:hypothetical protein